MIARFTRYYLSFASRLAFLALRSKDFFARRGSGVTPCGQPFRFDLIRGSWRVHGKLPPYGKLPIGNSWLYGVHLQSSAKVTPKGVQTASFLSHLNP